MNRVIREDAEIILATMKENLEPLRDSLLLVTGAQGFLCSYLLDVISVVNDATGLGCRILAVDNQQSGVATRTAHLQGREDIEFRSADICTPLDLEQKPDWILHGASVASPTFYRSFPLETLSVNIDGTRQLLDIARSGVRSLLHVSTSEIYGDPDPAAIPTPESYRGDVSCTGPRACYDESKRVSETFCQIYYKQFGVPVKVVRPFNIYGPGIRLDDGRIVPDLVHAALNGEPLILYGDGRATRSFCYIRDAAEALLGLLLSDANGEAFNMGNPQEITIQELAELVAHVAGPPVLQVRHATNDDEDYLTDSPQRRCPDIGKISASLGWSPSVELEEGIARTLRSFRDG